MQGNIAEIVVFVIYLLFMLGIGVFFFFKSKNGGEKTYFLGGREMGPWVTALSAGASDMSAWVLMGLPTSIYALGVGQVWIPVGLAIGYTISWLLEAPRLRRFSIVANDSITIPQYLTNRFLSASKALQVICAVVFLVAYTVYAASSVKACGILFHKVLGIDAQIAMYVAAVVIIGYTFLGGFSAVCWTDFFQGMLILAAMLAAPICAVSMDNFSLAAASGISAQTPGFWNPFANWKDIASGLGWGLGYFGMPHIIIRFMSLKSQKDLKKSAKIGITWTLIIVIFAALIGIIGRMFLEFDQDTVDNSLVFINMVREIFNHVKVVGPIICGILLSAVLAASMSTADSQLLAASSAFSSDVYNPVIRKNKASDKEMLWAGRIVVLVIAVLALVIASNPNSGSIMDLVENAWGVFGAAFGPAIMLSLFWKRFNFPGAVAGIVTGAVVDIGWYVLFNNAPTCVLSEPMGVYEIIPGFVAGIVVAIIVTLITKKPSKEVEKLFDDAMAFDDSDVQKEAVTVK
ncbi:MAG: sodium/proline symporter [Ruminococcus sp.]|nr:sodium/proline symporter [Candidatus Copronaster equi]